MLWHFVLLGPEASVTGGVCLISKGFMLEGLNTGTKITGDSIF